jgi:rod shape determining protein RodA
MIQVAVPVPTPDEPRRRLRYVDWWLVVATVLLVAIGTVMVWSATRTADQPLGLVYARVVHVVVGGLAMAACVALPYRSLGEAWKVIYAGNLVLLALVDVLGRTALGAQRWLVIGPLSLQPSEFAKLGIIVTLAWILSRRREPFHRPMDLVPYLLHVAPAFVLVFLQPNLGTSLVFLAILFAMLFAAGVPGRHLAGLAGLGVAALPLVWHLLLPYQRSRLMVFADPNLDPLGAGYSLIQSKIAIGSGQMWGKGLFEGTQNVLQFLPMQHTDFVFAVIGEEFGFVGGVAILLLFWVWLMRALRIAFVARDPFGAYLTVGIVSMVAFHVFVNVGMTIGIMPVTGIPLPFLSYGGSALVTNLSAAGILLSVAIRRRKIEF